MFLDQYKTITFIFRDNINVNILATPSGLSEQLDMVLCYPSN